MPSPWDFRWQVTGFKGAIGVGVATGSGLIDLKEQPQPNGQCSHELTASSALGLGGGVSTLGDVWNFSSIPDNVECPCEPGDWIEVYTIMGLIFHFTRYKYHFRHVLAYHTDFGFALGAGVVRFKFTVS